MTFFPMDLFVSASEMEQLQSALINIHQPTAMQDIIDAETARIDDYTLRYEIGDLRYKRLIRALSIYRIYGLLGPVPENHKAGYDEAMKELENIRDGKFPDLRLRAATAATLAAGTGKWGGQTKIT